MDKKEMTAMRLDGATYRQIGEEFGVSRQRAQQILSPPASIRRYIVKKYNGRCNGCGIIVEKSGHVHHVNTDNGENYEDIDNLQLLCISCHRGKHDPKLNKKLNSLDLVTFTEAANLLNISRPTVYNLVKKQRLHPVVFGRNRYLLRAEIETLKKV